MTLPLDQISIDEWPFQVKGIALGHRGSSSVHWCYPTARIMLRGNDPTYGDALISEAAGFFPGGCC